MTAQSPSTARHPSACSAAPRTTSLWSARRARTRATAAASPLSTTLGSAMSAAHRIGGRPSASSPRRRPTTSASPRTARVRSASQHAPTALPSPRQPRTPSMAQRSPLAATLETLLIALERMAASPLWIHGSTSATVARSPRTPARAKKSSACRMDLSSRALQALPAPGHRRCGSARRLCWRRFSRTTWACRRALAHCSSSPGPAQAAATRSASPSHRKTCQRTASADCCR
mmetsp:Transcript_80935/g.219226  ORF Transcript_80935/g.219226 Transcript_80935/m.219226 type:complete len:231 (-) Transcript_80935:38-730(-)